MNRRTVDTRLSSSAPTHLIKREPGNEASPDDTLLSVPTRGQVNFKILKEYGI